MQSDWSIARNWGLKQANGNTYWNETQYTNILRHPHDIQMVSMATTNNKQPQAVFFKITSSLLKLANYSGTSDNGPSQ